MRGIQRCAQSTTCRTIGTVLAVTAATIICTTCTVGAALVGAGVGGTIGGAVGVARCDGNAACVLQHASVGAISGAAGATAVGATASAGFVAAGAASGLVSELTGQAITGDLNTTNLIRSTAIGGALGGTTQWLTNRLTPRTSAPPSATNPPAVGQPASTATNTVDDFFQVTARGANRAGTMVPESFDLTVAGQKFAVNPNATKHMAEYATSTGASGVPMSSFAGSVEAAVQGGLQPGRNFLPVGPWELGIDTNGNVIYHAVYRPGAG